MGFLETVNDSPTSIPFISKLTNLKPVLPIMAFPGSYAAPITPGLGIRQLRAAPTAQSPITLFKLDHPAPAYFALPIHCWENRKKGFPAVPLALSSAFNQPHVAPHGPVCPSFSWELWVINYLFNGKHLLTCWPHHSWTKQQNLHFKTVEFLERLLSSW